MEMINIIYYIYFNICYRIFLYFDYFVSNCNVNLSSCFIYLIYICILVIIISFISNFISNFIFIFIYISTFNSISTYVALYTSSLIYIAINMIVP
jgi:hypothetical protein